MNDGNETLAGATVAAEDLPDGGERQVLVLYGAGGQSRVLELPDGAEVTFGRSRSSTVQVDSDAASRLHCRVTRTGRQVVLEDLGSRNGTRRNGETISAPTELSSGDEITVGPLSAVYVVTSAARRRTRLGSGAHLEERLAAECDRGSRYGRRFALLMLRVTGDEAEVDDAIDRIAERLRPMDVLAEWGPDELAILCPEADAADAGALAERLAAELRRAGSLELRTGLALYPEHATSPDAILSRAHDALRSAATERRTQPVTAAPSGDLGDEVVAGDPQMKRVFSLVDKVAPTPITVLIHGETGAGKEVVAAAIHRCSDRKNAPFVRLNCASLPETLLESELFGHERGAFTGADRRKEGYFEAASGGVIFLDEIGEISPGLQAKLLRVLEERCFTRVGGTREISVDVRVLCATNRDLETEVAAGRFREDLYFRISAFTIVVPPLRSRRGDILPLAEHFLRLAAAEIGVQTPVLTTDAQHLLERYAWPGNVRQLKNAMDRAVVLCDSGGAVEVTHLPDRVREEALATPAGVGASGDVRDKLADVERAAIVEALEACGGNQTHAARKLGLSRRALIYKMEKYGLKRAPASRR